MGELTALHRELAGLCAARGAFRQAGPPHQHARAIQNDQYSFFQPAHLGAHAAADGFVMAALAQVRLATRPRVLEEVQRLASCRSRWKGHVGVGSNQHCGQGRVGRVG
jgi:hypothetical protein